MLLSPGGDRCNCEVAYSAVQESAEGIVPVLYGEGLNSVERLSGVESYG